MTAVKQILPVITLAVLLIEGNYIKQDRLGKVRYERR